MRRLAGERRTSLAVRRLLHECAYQASFLLGVRSVAGRGTAIAATTTNIAATIASIATTATTSATTATV